MPDWLPELAAAIFAVIFAITLHEAAHGYAARALGDDTAERMGRISLNPLRHVDPVGTLLLPGIMVVGQLLTIGTVQAMFGWAKPVPVDFGRLRHPRRDMMLVAAAGPAINAVLAIAAGFSLHGASALDPYLSDQAAEFVLRLCALSILSNLVLGLFNLIPLLPLDGGRILLGLLPARLALPFARTERHGLLIVIMGLFIAPLIVRDWQPMGWFVANIVWPVLTAVLYLTGNAP